LPLFLGSCFEDEEKTEFLASQVESLDEQLKALKEELSEIEEETDGISREISDLENKRRNVRMLQKQEVEAIRALSDVKDYEHALSDSFRQLDAALASWKDASRHSFKGLTVASFAPSGSPILTNPVVMKVADEGVTFKLAAGEVTTVPFAHLTDQLREALVDEALYLSKTIPAAETP
jgi:hypothetical protein